jgi:hypothetical protein
MRSKLLFVPAAVMALSGPAAGSDLLTVEAAQERLFPGEKLISADFKLSPEQFEQLKAEYKVPALRPAFKAWRAPDGSWLFLDQVYGLNDIVTYMVAVDSASNVRGVEVLVCAEGFCDIAEPKWHTQLVGKAHGKWTPADEVTNISGATLSTVHVTEGIKKILAIHARYLPKVD